MKETVGSQMNVKVPAAMRPELRSVAKETRRSFSSLVHEAWDWFRASGKPTGSSKRHNQKTRGAVGREARPVQGHGQGRPPAS